MRVHNLHVDDTVYAHGHVVRGDAGLGRHVQHCFLQGAHIGLPVYNGNDDVESGQKRCPVLAKTLNDDGLLVGDNDDAFYEEGYDKQGQKHNGQGIENLLRIHTSLSL